jgi:hypothetical protein
LEISVGSTDDVGCRRHEWDHYRKEARKDRNVTHALSSDE